MDGSQEVVLQTFFKGMEHKQENQEREVEGKEIVVVMVGTVR